MILLPITFVTSIGITSLRSSLIWLELRFCFFFGIGIRIKPYTFFFLFPADFCCSEKVLLYVPSLLIVEIAKIFFRLIDGIRRDTILMTTFSTFPYVVVIVKARLLIKVCIATVAIPINVWEPFTHNLFILSSIHQSTELWNDITMCMW